MEFAPGRSADSHALFGRLPVVLRVISTLGLLVAEDKLEGPSMRLSFLSLEIDTVAMELRLPAEKLRDLQVLIHSYGVVGGWLPSWS